jgi:hypothetical protein
MKQNTMLKLVVLAGAEAMPTSTSTASAQSADALVDKLVEKGVLSVKEANELRKEADKGFTRAYSVKSGMSDWVTALKFNGDFRGRFEGSYSKTYDYIDRNRWRYRARFGVTASLLEGFEVGLRSGAGDTDSYPTAGIDPISSNQTFSRNGSKKGIFLDLTYGKWTPWNGAKGSALIALRKIENPFVFSDLVFDGDYTHGGLGMQFGYNFPHNHPLKANVGGFALDEIGASTEDPCVLGAQVRPDSTWNPHLNSSVGVGVLGITAEERLSNTSVPNINLGNTRTAAGTPTYDLNPVVGDASLTYSLESAPFYPGASPIRVGGDYMYNGGAPDAAENYGWSAGITSGKAGKRKTWELAHTYKWLGANS